METPLNLREVLRFGLVGFADGGVDVFLAGDDDPGAAVAEGAQLLGDGLEGQHQLRVVTDELADFIDQEDDAMAGRLGIEVLAESTWPSPRC